MATEELIVLLDARTAKLDAKLNSTNAKLDKLDGSTQKTDKSFLSLSKAGTIAATGIATIATAAIAVNAAISAMVLNSAKNRKELELLSSQAKTSTEDFQALVFATQKYGINAEQIADISKDIADKIGEFSAAGTGTFQDYADVMKLTKDEARKVAIEFQGLSSQEVIGKMISEMEGAKVTGDQMTFVLESMGNDLSRLKPLFSDNSKELGILKDRFNDVNGSLSITAGQAAGLKEVATSFDLMTSQLGNASTAISATLAPVMDDFFNDVISIVPEATQTIIDFANSFLDAENISSQSGVSNQIQDSQARILEYQEKITGFRKAQNSYSKDSGESNVRAISQLEASIEFERIRTEELNTQLELLKEQSLALEDANTLKGGEIGGEIGGKVIASSGTGTGDELQEIRDRYKSEEELLQEKFERELEMIGEDEILKLERKNQFIEDMLELDQKYADEKEKIQAEADKDKTKNDSDRHKVEQKLEETNVKSLMQITGSLIGNSNAIGKALFLVNQGVALADAFVNTQAASVKALTIDPTGVLSAKVQAAGTLSMAAIAAATIGGIAGGSNSGSLGAASAGGTSQQPQQPEPIEQSSLSLSTQDENGSNEIVVRFATDSGDDYLDMLANGLNERNRQGR